MVDTDTLSLYQTRHVKVAAAVDARSSGEVRVTIISVEEQFIGWHASARQARRTDQLAFAYEGMARAASSLARFTILSDPATAEQQFRKLRKLFPRHGANDLRSAAIALELGATVVTHNVKDFACVPGLSVVDWAT